MQALVYHGPKQKSWDDRAGADAPGPDRRDRPDRHDDDLRNRPAHPQGRRARGHPRDDPRPRGRRDDLGARQRRHRLRGRRPHPDLVHHVMRSLSVLQAGSLRPVHGRRRLDPRPPDRRRAGRVRAHPVRRHLRVQDPGGTHRRAGPVPRGHPPDGVRGRDPERPGQAGRRRRDRRRRPDRARRRLDREAVHARDHRRPRRRRRAARAREGVRRGRDDQQRHRRRRCEDHGADRGSRRRRCDRGGRRSGDVRALLRDRELRRHRRERRRARQPGDAAPGEALDQGRHDHDGARRHVHDADAAQADRTGTARRNAVHDAPVQVERGDRGVRRVRRSCRDERPQGRARR